MKKSYRAMAKEIGVDEGLITYIRENISSDGREYRFEGSYRGKRIVKTGDSERGVIELAARHMQMIKEVQDTKIATQLDVLRMVAKTINERLTKRGNVSVEYERRDRAFAVSTHTEHGTLRSRHDFRGAMEFLQGMVEALGYLA